MNPIPNLENHKNLEKYILKVEKRINEGDSEDAAVNLRKALECIVEQYIKKYAPESVNVDLRTSIDEINTTGVLSYEYIDLFHKVRMIGNDGGAHATEYGVDMNRVKKAYDNLVAFLEKFLEEFPTPYVDMGDPDRAKKIPYYYYKILGLDKNATQQEIEANFKKLAKKYHPDSPGGNEQMFKDISEAKTTLTNAVKKERYDQEQEYLEAEKQASDNSKQYSNSASSNYTSAPFRNTNRNSGYNDSYYTASYYTNNADDEPIKKTKITDKIVFTFLPASILIGFIWCMFIAKGESISFYIRTISIFIGIASTLCTSLIGVLASYMVGSKTTSEFGIMIQYIVILVSIIPLFLITLRFILRKEKEGWRKGYVAIVFIVCCILGVNAAINIGVYSKTTNEGVLPEAIMNELSRPEDRGLDDFNIDNLSQEIYNYDCVATLNAEKVKRENEKYTTTSYLKVCNIYTLEDVKEYASSNEIPFEVDIDLALYDVYFIHYAWKTTDGASTRIKSSLNAKISTYKTESIHEYIEKYKEENGVELDYKVDIVEFESPYYVPNGNVVEDGYIYLKVPKDFDQFFLTVNVDNKSLNKHLVSISISKLLNQN